LTDLSLAWDSEHGNADLTYTAGDLQLDGGLETAVLLSLFTGDADGWWGDAFPIVSGDVFGSELYEISRTTSTATTTRRAQEVAEAALAWLVEDAVASSVSVVVTATAPVLHWEVNIQRPSAAPAVYRYSYNWQAQEMKRAV
jgi:phage gp46-like protein